MVRVTHQRIHDGQQGIPTAPVRESITAPHGKYGTASYQLAAQSASIALVYVLEMRADSWCFEVRRSLTGLPHTNHLLNRLLTRIPRKQCQTKIRLAVF